jgi:ATP-binding cassette, subfamily B, bacterial MsbA
VTSLDEYESNRVPDRGRPPFVRLLHYVRPYMALVVFALLLSGGLSGAQYARAYLMKPIFDQVLLPSFNLRQSGSRILWKNPLDFFKGGGAEDRGAARPAPATDAAEAANIEALAQIQRSLFNVIGIAILIVVSMPLLMFSREYVMSYTLGRIELDMKVDVCGKLLALPLRFHQDRKRGDVLSRVIADVGGAHAALSLLFGDLLEAALMIVVGAGALLLVSWKLSLVMLVAGPLIFGVISIFGQRIRKSARRRQEQVADVTQRLIEILAGIKVIKAFRAEHFESEGFARASHKLFRRGMKVVKNRVLARALVDMLNNAVGMSVLVLGIYLVMRSRWDLTAGDLAAFFGITTTLYRPVKSAAKGWVRLMDALPSADRLFEVLDSPVAIHDSSDAVPMAPLCQSVVLRDVSFSYDREPVLRGVSFEVRAGQMLAIVGRTGAGKTTLADLLLRLHDPTSGTIEIDGVDIRKLRRDSLLDRMAVVGQEPFLFDGTIRDNILYGRTSASADEVIAAARAAHVVEFVDRLPEGYETLVGAAGTRLSGGQRQRITIARAILRDPDILIFDEATSSLDSQSERLVQEAIDALLGGRTVFVIAHRLSTVRRADKIIVLEDGKISQSGSHDELVAAGGLYKDLLDLQSLEGPG